MRWRIRLLGVALGVLTTVILAVGHHGVGYVRDEGVYFEAGRSYAAWVDKLFRSPKTALRRDQRDRHFGVNHEHPALIKTLAGTSGRLLARAPNNDPNAIGAIPTLREGAAMRLPAQIIAGIGVCLLFFAGYLMGGLTCGLLAAGWFVLLPRVAFHAGLCGFDVPVAVATLAVVLAYRRSLSSRAWGIAVGPLLGLAIAVKHNALFLGPLLALHYVVCLAWARFREGRRLRWAQLVPAPFVSMAVLAPLVALALWPWLWTDPIGRTLDYFEFHRQHSYYNMEFLGHNYNLPPLPVSYPFVMTWATVPSVLLVLALLGLGLSLRADLRGGREPGKSRPRWTAPLPDGWCRHDGALLISLSAFPLLLIAMPWIPIFGGTKHWLTAYPFLALAAAGAWHRLWGAFEPKRWVKPVALVVCLAPSALATVQGHPYNLSQYAPLVGGARGAADLGLNRGFWGHSVLPILTELEQGQPRGGGVYIHDIETLALQQYLREGRWPERFKPSPIGRARVGLLVHERHMATYEHQLWNRLRTTAPAMVVTLDDVPLTSLYVAGGP